MSSSQERRAPIARFVQAKFIKLGPRRVVGLALGLAIVALTYQNCAEPRNSSILGSTEAKTPFAFETSVDHLAYMSCGELSAGSYDRSTFFTFRVGAYGETAGLRLTQDFIDYTEYLDKNRRAELLANSPRNQGAKLHLAVRASSDIHKLFLGNSGSPRPDADYQYLLGTLSTSAYLNPIFSRDLGAWHRYIPGLSGLYGKRVEGSLSFVESAAQERDIGEQILNSGGLIALTYSSATYPDDKGLARSPAEFEEGAPDSAFQKVYGKGLRYTLKMNGTYNQYKRSRALASVDTVDLLSGSPDNHEYWSCPADMVFKIVRNVDAAANCPKIADPASPSARLRSVRRLLPVEDWWLNESLQCVVPKKAGECYPSTVQKVVYDPTLACGDKNVADQGVCAHYVSFCLR